MSDLREIEGRRRRKDGDEGKVIDRNVFITVNYLPLISVFPSPSPFNFQFYFEMKKGKV